MKTIENNKKESAEKEQKQKSEIIKNVNNPLNDYSSRKKYLWGGIVVVVILLITGGAIYYFQKSHSEELNQMAQKNADLSLQINERDSLINEWVAAFSQIEKDLNLIKDKEQLLEVKSEDKEFSKDRKEEIIADIQFINSLLESNKKKINQLNSRLHKSGIKIAGLEKKINELENNLSMRDSSINTLKSMLVERDFEMAKLNDKMDEMEMKVNQQNIIIDMQTNEMNKAYLAYGTYKELKEKGLITKDGGFLWIGQEVSLKENFPEDKFTEINILETKTIPVHSKKAELITNHPKGSYDFVKDSTHTIAYLEIKDPLEFWKISKYAVLETK